MVSLLIIFCFIAWSLANEMQSMLFGLFGMPWVMPRSVLGLLDCWQGRFGWHRNVIWYALEHKSLEGCASLFDVVSLARAESA